MLRKRKNRIIFITFFLSTLLAFGQDFSELKLELIKQFPELGSKHIITKLNTPLYLIDNDTLDAGVWVFYEDNFQIEQIKSDIIEKKLIGYNLFEVQLTNFLGYHIDEANCLIVYNSKTKDMIMIEPVTYNGRNDKLIRLLLNKNFASEIEVKKFAKELQKVLLIGSSNMKIQNTQVEPKSISFDLIYERATKTNIWRQIELTFDNYKFVRFKITHPKTKEQIVWE